MSETQGLIFDIRKFSVNDGPGIRTTVFFKGCPLSCWWCHNPESQSPALELMLWEGRCIRCGECATKCPLDAISENDGSYETDRTRCVVCESCMAACAADARELVGRRVTVPEVMAEIRRDLPFYETSGGGVTFSGGEPLSQRAFLRELLIACKALGLHTTVDTSGYAPWEVLESIREYVDLFLYDIKVMDDGRHREYTGVPNGLILHNLQALAARGHRIIVRVPLIPGLNDDAENLGMLAAFCNSLPRLERIDFLPFHPSAEGKYERLSIPYRMPETPIPADAHMQAIKRLFEEHNLTVTIGG